MVDSARRLGDHVKCRLWCPACRPFDVGRRRRLKAQGRRTQQMRDMAHIAWANSLLEVYG
jgi:hypothetical protein